MRREGVLTHCRRAVSGGDAWKRQTRGKRVASAVQDTIINLPPASRVSEGLGQENRVARKCQWLGGKERRRTNVREQSQKECVVFGSQTTYLLLIW